MSSFDSLAGLSEMEGGHFARRKRANIVAARAARTAAAQAEYDRTGKVPEGFKMVFGRIGSGPWEHPTTPAEFTRAAQAMTGQPAAPAQVERKKFTSMPRGGRDQRKGFLHNVRHGHIKADDLTPEFWASLSDQDKRHVDQALADAGETQPVVSDVDFNRMVEMMEASLFDRVVGNLDETAGHVETCVSRFDEMCSLAEGSGGEKRTLRIMKSSNK